MQLIKQTKYLNFTDISELYPTRKTKTIGIGNNYGDKLGLIEWIPSFRKYGFVPYGETRYDTGCLNEIIEVISQLMKQRK